MDKYINWITEKSIFWTLSLIGTLPVAREGNLMPSWMASVATVKKSDAELVVSNGESWLFVLLFLIAIGTTCYALMKRDINYRCFIFRIPAIAVLALLGLPAFGVTFGTFLYFSLIGLCLYTVIIYSISTELPFISVLIALFIGVVFVAASTTYDITHFWEILALIIWFCVGRFIAQTRKQNQDYFSSKKPKKWIHTTYKTLPFILVAGAILLVNGKFVDWVQHEAYTTELEEHGKILFKCYSIYGGEIEIKKFEGDQGARKCSTSLRHNARINVNNFLEHFDYQQQEVAVKLKTVSSTQAAEFPGAVEDTLNKVVKKCIFCAPYPRGGFLSSGWIKRKIFKGIDRSYARTREQMIADAKKDAAVFAGDAKNASTDSTTYASKKITELSAKAKPGILESIDRSFISWELFSFLTNLFTLLVLIKVWVWVFVRVHAKEITELTLPFFLANEGQWKKGAIAKSVDKYEYKRKAMDSVYNYALSFRPEGDEFHIDLKPKNPGTLILMRLFSRYIMRRVDYNKPYYKTQNPEFSSKNNMQFVEWKLGENQQVAFKMEHLVLVSSKVELEGLYNFRLLGLAFGKVRYATAKGPGVLVLRSFGTTKTPADYKKEQKYADVATSRLLAWDVNAAFGVLGSSTWGNLYGNETQVRVPWNSQAIIDTDADHSTGGKLIGMFKWLFVF